MHPDAWHRAGRHQRVLDHDLFSVELGAGPVMVLIHGFPSSSWDWSRIAPALATDHRVIAIDLLGFGRSAKPRCAYTVAMQAELVTALLAQHELLDRPLDVVSHDLGNTVVSELLAQGRITINRLVMLNGGLLPEHHRPILAQRVLRTPLAPVAVKLMTRRRFVRTALAACGPEHRNATEHFEHAFELLSRDDGLARCARLIHYLDERVTYRERWVGALTQSAARLRLIWGDADPVASWQTAEAISTLRPATDVVRLSGVGHTPQIEVPALVAKAIAEWCR